MAGVREIIPYMASGTRGLTGPAVSVIPIGSLWRSVGSERSAQLECLQGAGARATLDDAADRVYIWARRDACRGRLIAGRPGREQAAEHRETTNRVEMR